MNWKKWIEWKNKYYIAVVLFTLAYILTIPVRDYSFLEGLVDITSGVPIWAHLMVIVIGVIVLLVLLKILEIIVKMFVK